MTDVKTPPPFRENGLYTHAILERQPAGDNWEILTLACGHRVRVTLSPGATALRCRYCVREEWGAANHEDPTPPKINPTKRV